MIFGVIFMIFSFLHHRDEIGEDKRRIRLYLIAGSITLFMVTNMFPWNLFRKITVIETFIEKLQFIWRFNIFTVLFFSVVAAYGFYYYFVKDSQNKYKEITKLALLSCAVSLIYLNQFVMYANQVNNDELLYNGAMDMLYVVPGYHNEPDAVPESNSTTMQIENIMRDTLEISFDYRDYHANSDVYIDVPFTYYPGYKAYINDEKTVTECSDTGTVRVNIPIEKSEGHLRVVYKEEGMIAIGNYISLVSWGLAIIGIVSKYRDRWSKNANTGSNIKKRYSNGKE